MLLRALPVLIASTFAVSTCAFAATRTAFAAMPSAKTSPAYWASHLSRALPEHKEGERLPSIFLAHGSPLLVWPSHLPMSQRFPLETGGPSGSHQAFLRAFGPFLLERYRPKAIVVFSAHWETSDAIEVTDDTVNPLLYDYYGFPREMYDIKWESRGSRELSSRVASLLESKGIGARKIKQNSRGLDHGVFIPFMLMFPEQPFPIPVIEVSMPSSLNPDELIRLGQAIEPLRDEGVLVISGGLTVHTFNELKAWEEKTAEKGFVDLHESILKAIEADGASSADERHRGLKALMKHPFMRRAHPREEHFVPLYIAAGAGSNGRPAIVCPEYGIITAAFGL